MSLLNDLLSQIGQWAIQLISFLGYGGVFFLMMLESMVAPVPSELPFVRTAQKAFSGALITC